MTSIDTRAVISIKDVDDCANLRMRYLEGCLLLEQAEADMASEARLELARKSVTDFRRSWLASVQQIINEPSFTPAILLAKARIVIEMLRELCSGDDEIASVTITFVEDVERLLRQDHGS